MGATTLSITTLSIMTLSIMTFSVMTLSRMTFRIMTYSSAFLVKVTLVAKYFQWSSSTAESAKALN